ncbi:MAG: twin-arginine translocation signal domain-containing protein, partial [Thermoguttaceae bacterium]
MNRKHSRRDFLKISGATAGVTSAGFWLSAGNQKTARASANSKIAFAGVGIEGKGSGDIGNAAKFGEVVAVCDADRNRVKNSSERFKGVPAFTDY